MKSYDVFISHSSHDNDIARKLYAFLKGLGLKPWIDLYDITPGMPYARSIIQGVETCEAMVVILSKNSNLSENVINEVDNAHRLNKVIFPFMVDDSEMSHELLYYLSRKQWIKAFPEPEDHFQELVNALFEQLGKEHENVDIESAPSNSNNVNLKQHIPTSDEKKRKRKLKIGCSVSIILVVSLSIILPFTFIVNEKSPRKSPISYIDETQIEKDAVKHSESSNRPATKTSVSSKPKHIPRPKAIDLGLSVKWASFNLGAGSPEDYGSYYKWGETEPTDTCGWATYKYARGAYNKLTKYCTDSEYCYNGSIDGKKILEPQDDAATTNLGSKWRMPTLAEIKELIDKCKQVWTTINDVNGILVTGPNGNTVFFPASGYMDSSIGSLKNVGVSGHYWSATLYNSIIGHYFYFKYGYWGWSSYYRSFGYSIRPVCSK